MGILDGLSGVFSWTKYLNPIWYYTFGQFIFREQPLGPPGEDMRKKYAAQAANYGDVVPTVYGTTLIDAPAYSRGRVLVQRDAADPGVRPTPGRPSTSIQPWKQYGLALGLCQGPITAVQAIWMSDGSADDATKKARIPYSVAADCGLVLQPGAFANQAIAPTFTSDATRDVKGWGSGTTAYVIIAATSNRSFLPAFAGVGSVHISNAKYDTGTTVRGLSIIGSVPEADYPVVSVTEKTLTLTNNTGQPFVVNGTTLATAKTFDQSAFEIRAAAGGYYYPGIAYLRGDPVDLARLYKPLDEAWSLTPKYRAEVTGFFPGYGPGGLEAQPLSVLWDIAGSNYWSANSGITLETTIGAGGDANSGYERFCHAAGYYVSGALREQRSAAEHMQTVLDATDAVAVWSEGKLKILPLGDETITSSTYTYTPNTTPVYDLGSSDLVADKDEPMVQMSALPGDSINVVSVEYLNRDAMNANYRVSVETAYDGADIERQAALTGGTGKREAALSAMHFITDPAHARHIAQVRLQRARAVITGQTFRLGWRFAVLEPMDLVTVTDPNLQLDHEVLRVAAWEENETGEITVESMSWPLGIAGNKRYSTASSDAGLPPLATDPGTCQPPLVGVLPPTLAGYDPTVWIAVTGSAELYGGCDVYVSTDNVAFDYLGTILGRSCIGYLTADLPSGAALDTVNTLSVDVGWSMGTLAGTTSAGRDALETLSVVGSEYLAFQTATPGSAAYTYDLTSLRRGAYESAISAHFSVDRFVRLDRSVLHVALPRSYFGTTIYLKAQPFNRYGSGRPALSSVASYSYTLGVPTLSAPSACAITVSTSAPAVVPHQYRTTAQENLMTRYANVTWTPASALASGFDVVIYTGSDPTDASKYVASILAGQIDGTMTSAVIAVSAGASPLTVYAAVRARLPNGTVSAWQQSATTATIDPGGTPALPKLMHLTQTGSTFTFDAVGNPVPTVQTITFVAAAQNITGSFTMTCNLYDAAGVEITPAPTLGGTVGSDTRTLTAAQFSSAASAKVTCTADGITDYASVTRNVLAASAKLVRLVASGLEFTYGPTGAADPTAQTLTFDVAKENLTGTATLECRLYDVNDVELTGGVSPVTLGGSGDTGRTLTVAQFTTADHAKVTATLSGYTDKMQVVRLVDGSQAVTPVVPNQAHSLPAALSGGQYVVSDYTGSGTTIRIFEGNTALTYHTTLAAGRWKIDSTTLNPAAFITVGAVSGSGTTTATVAQHSAMSDTVDVGTITWAITVRRQDGTDVPVTITQTLTKSKQGATGNQGPTGNPGADALAPWLSRESIGLAANNDGTLKGTSPYATCQFKVFKGVTEQTGWTFAASPVSGGDLTYTGWQGLNANLLTVTGMANAVFTTVITCTATKTGEPALTRALSVMKGIDGAVGAKGDTGNTGATGTRGSLTLYLTGTAWSDQAAWDACNAYTAPVIRDTVTISSSATGFSQTKFLSSLTPAPYGTWTTITQVVDGNLLVNGTVGTDKVAAGSITTMHMKVQGAEATLNCDPGMQSVQLDNGTGQAWGRYDYTALGNYRQRVSVTDLPGRVYAVANNTGEATVSQSELIPIDSSRHYRLSIDYKHNGTAGLIESGLRWYDGAAALIADPTPTGWTNSTTYDASLLLSGVTPTASWQTATTKFGSGETRVIPDTARWCRIFTIHNSGSAAGSVVSVSDAKVQEQVDGNLLVDGTVTATACTASVFQTSNYSGSGTGDSEYALLGAKMRQNASGQVASLLVDPAGLKIGQETFKNIPVLARAYITSGYTQGSSTTWRMNFATVEIDTNSAITTGASWVFTTPRAGHYILMVRDSFAPSATAGRGSVYYQVYKNGTSIRALDSVVYSDIALMQGAALTTVLPSLAVNDTIYVTVLNSTATSLNHYSPQTCIEIWRLQLS